MQKHYATVPERKAAFLRAIGGKNAIDRLRLEMNNWLEEIGKPELKLSLEEALDLALGGIH